MNLDFIYAIPLYITFSSIVQVLVLSMIFYYILIFLKGTRGAQILLGMVIFIIVLISLTNFFHLESLNWILARISVYLSLAFLVIFQPEIRRALAELGRQPVFTVNTATKTGLDNIVSAVTSLAEKRVGCLIAIEREKDSQNIRESGVMLDAPVISELIQTIFYPKTPLHDGGLIIGDNKIKAAKCIFPLSQNQDLFKQLGTRHRAAVGMSEEYDCVVIVVSEETGSISVSYRGRLSRGMNQEKLRRFLDALLFKDKRNSVWKRAQAQLDLTPEGIAKTENTSKSGE
ncbi:MAG: diadenylate cyclase CdaA [Kiritimatiellae bacterium]|jgi:diadenylate cyclase|nr:diadenylate cyclase CdaA [Kiritimatiellia bacterium]